jgi:hypothetical protein
VEPDAEGGRADSVIATFEPAAVFAGLVKAEGIRRGADHVRELGAVSVTAEAAVLNFTSTTQLDPSDYTNPEQLLNNVGTAFLTTLPGWFVWVVLLLALYLLPRVGRIVDTTVTGRTGSLDRSRTRRRKQR